MLRRTLPLMLALTFAAAAPVFAQRWEQLYDEAIVHVNRGQWLLAEQKLMQARKLGPDVANRRRAIRRQGMLYDDFFPEYFLGIVYLSTDRPQQAVQAFAAARKLGIDPRAAPFKAITDYETKATEAVRVAREKFRGEFIGLLAQARDQLGQGNYDAAEKTAGSARDLAARENLDLVRPQADALLGDIGNARQAATRVEDALKSGDPNAARKALAGLALPANAPVVVSLRSRIQDLDDKIASNKPPLPPPGPGPGPITPTPVDPPKVEPPPKVDTTPKVDVNALAARVDDAVKRRNGTDARRELNGLAAVAPTAPVLKTLTTRVLQLERELQSERLVSDAMRAFYVGNYQQTLTVLQQVDQLKLPLSARGYFYRACSLAAQAARSGLPADDPQVRQARQVYRLAARSPAEYKADLRFISPKIQTMLGVQ